MDIKRAGSQPSGKGPAEYFTVESGREAFAHPGKLRATIERIEE